MIKTIVMPVINKLPPYVDDVEVVRAQGKLLEQQKECEDKLNTLLNRGFTVVLSERLETPDEVDILIFLYKKDEQPLTRTAAIDELLDEDRED